MSKTHRKKKARLKAFLNVEQTWNTEREALNARLDEAKRLLASEQSSWDADRYILQSNLDATCDEVSRTEKIQAKSS